MFRPRANRDSLAQHLAGTLAVDVDEGGFHIHAATEVIAGGLNQQRTDIGRIYLIENVVEGRKEIVVGEVNGRVINRDDCRYLPTF